MTNPNDTQKLTSTEAYALVKKASRDVAHARRIASSRPNDRAARSNLEVACKVRDDAYDVYIRIAKS